MRIIGPVWVYCMPKKSSATSRSARPSPRDLDIEIGFLEGVVRRDPEYLEALQVLGDDYTRRGKYADGLRVDEQLARLRPEDSLVHYNLACSYALTDHFDEAVAALDRALTLGYRDFKWLSKDPDLTKLREHPLFKKIRARVKALKVKRGENSLRASPLPIMNVTLRGRTRHYRTVTFAADKNAVVLVEQRLLPHQFQTVATRTYRETAAAIRDMVVRGAGAIGATAAYGLAQGARAFRGGNLKKFHAYVDQVTATLTAARPTAVDPVNAMCQVRQHMSAGATVGEQQALALAAAEEFANEDAAHCAAIGEHGAPLIAEGMNILTHCNAGWLAFVDVGSATAPMYAAQAQGRKFHVYCDETRPRSQGATLTAWELAQQGVSHQIIADNAAGFLMQRGEIDLVIVGSDRTLGRTGEVTNKIGTYTKAVLARRHGIPFFVAIPLSTIDWNLKSGADIPIEERNESEVLGAWGVNDAGRRQYVGVANPGSGARNPGFDVTPPELITGIITPVGIFKPKELWGRRKQLSGAHVKH